MQELDSITVTIPHDKLECCTDVLDQMIKETNTNIEVSKLNNILVDQKNIQEQMK